MKKISGDVKAITISDGTEVIVDSDDYEKLTKYKWSANGNGYAVRGVHIGNRKYRKIYMHREILNVKSSEIVDHVNGNKFDNRKENLRVVTPSQNAVNAGRRKNNSSGYKGVFYESRRDKWRAEIKVNYRSVFLGYFDNKEDAAKAYNKAALKHHGEYAKFNKVKELKINA